jgi:hypothetical protein
MLRGVGSIIKIKVLNSKVYSMRQHRPTTNEAITDVKSRIVFETPENSDRQTITRNRSYSGYKLDTALLQQTGQAKYLLAAKHHVPQQYKP